MHHILTLLSRIGFLCSWVLFLFGLLCLRDHTSCSLSFIALVIALLSVFLHHSICQQEPQSACSNLHSSFSLPLLISHYPDTEKPTYSVLDVLLKFRRCVIQALANQLASTAGSHALKQSLRQQVFHPIGLVCVEIHALNKVDWNSSD